MSLVELQNAPELVASIHELKLDGATLSVSGASPNQVLNFNGAPVSGGGGGGGNTIQRLNDLTGDLAGGYNVDITSPDDSITINANATTNQLELTVTAGAGSVASINGEAGVLTLAGAGGLTVTNVAGAFTLTQGASSSTTAVATAQTLTMSTPNTVEKFNINVADTLVSTGFVGIPSILVIPININQTQGAGGNAYLPELYLSFENTAHTFFGGVIVGSSFSSQCKIVMPITYINATIATQQTRLSVFYSDLLELHTPVTWFNSALDPVNALTATTPTPVTASVLLARDYVYNPTCLVLDNVFNLSTIKQGSPTPADVTLRIAQGTVLATGTNGIAPATAQNANLAGCCVAYIV